MQQEFPSRYMLIKLNFTLHIVVYIFHICRLLTFRVYVFLQYGCIKGVYGTPFFFVNGFPLADDGSTLDYNKWRKIIHPLLKN